MKKLINRIEIKAEAEKSVESTNPWKSVIQTHLENLKGLGYE